MQTVAAFFPVARPRGAAAALLTVQGAAAARVAEAVALAFAIRDAGEDALRLHAVPAAAALPA